MGTGPVPVRQPLSPAGDRVPRGDPRGGTGGAEEGASCCAELLLGGRGGLGGRHPLYDDAGPCYVLQGWHLHLEGVVRRRRRRAGWCRWPACAVCSAVRSANASSRCRVLYTA